MAVISLWCMIMNLWDQTLLSSKTWRTSKLSNATRNNSKVVRPKGIYLQISNSKALLPARLPLISFKEAPWPNNKWYLLTVMLKAQIQSIYWITYLPNLALSTFKHQQQLTSLVIMFRMGTFKYKIMGLKYLIFSKLHNHLSHLGKTSKIMDRPGNQARWWYNSRMRYYSRSNLNHNLRGSSLLL